MAPPLPHWAASFVYLIWPGPNTSRPSIGQGAASLTLRHSGLKDANKPGHPGSGSSGAAPELAPSGPSARTLRVEISGQAHEILRGKVRASRGGVPRGSRDCGPPLSVPALSPSSRFFRPPVPGPASGQGGRDQRHKWEMQASSPRVLGKAWKAPWRR